MKTIAVKTFTAVITLGLEVGYSKEHYKKEYLVKELQAYQKKRIEEAIDPRI